MNNPVRPVKDDVVSLSERMGDWVRVVAPWNIVEYHKGLMRLVIRDWRPREETSVSLFVGRKGKTLFKSNIMKDAVRFARDYMYEHPGLTDK